ncbi:hypothetical protein JCM16303_004038 [Sporobolomyces ruberrimus]
MNDSHRPTSPPLTPLVLDSPSTSSPLSHFGASPARSSSLNSASTAYTTPSPGKNRGDQPWNHHEAFEFEKETSEAPHGFIHLDREYAKELGVKDVARSFAWQRASGLDSTRDVLKRRMGPTEASYYLGSRGQGLEGGVNDMYLHIGFQAPSHLVTEDRIHKIWKTLLARHTLLWSTVEFRDYRDIHFVNRLPQGEAEFDEIARSRLQLKPRTTSEEILVDYLNGERTLSDDKLASLVISTPEPTFGKKGDETQEFDFFLYSTHFLGDGMALHSTANEFFTLLASENVPVRVATPLNADRNLSHLPPALESEIETSPDWGKTAWSAAKVDFERNEAKNLGGQAFPRARLGPRHTLVPTVSYSPSDSSKILATCKAHKSTIASALFALSNLAYIRSTPSEKLNRELPTNLYSALNIRGFLKKDDERDWYHLAIGYYNIILPSFYPSSSSIPVSDYFWHQASSVRSQTSKVVKSRFLKSRALLMAFEREKRSIGFERADEVKKLSEEMKGLGISESGEKGEEVERMRKEAEEKEKERSTNGKEKEKTKVPNVSLMGLSMLGNLDGIYEHSKYLERGIELHTLTTGSRQRPGALLLFSYTFAGKVWLSLGYDSNGFEKGVIENWWKELLKGVDELLLLNP